MPSNICSQPFEHSMYKNTNDDFDDDLFNHHLIERRGGRGPHKNSYKSSEKKHIKNNDINDIFNRSNASSKISINLSEDINSYSIHANIPGITKNDIKVELNENRILTISGERKNSNENINNNNKSRDCDITSFERENENTKEIEKKNNEEQENKNENINENEVDLETDKTQKKAKETTNLNTQETKKYDNINSKQNKFIKSFKIPMDADIKNIQAKLENGVLEIIFNKMRIFNIQDHII